MKRVIMSMTKLLREPKIVIEEINKGKTVTIVSSSKVVMEIKKPKE